MVLKSIFRVFLLKRAAVYCQCTPGYLFECLVKCLPSSHSYHGVRLSFFKGCGPDSFEKGQIGKVEFASVFVWVMSSPESLTPPVKSPNLNKARSVPVLFQC